jgi:hypothetical protein
VCLVLGACGEREIAPALPPVQLVVDHPFDAQTVDADSIEVSGHVTPTDALVRVNGDAVSVSRGAFQTTVTLVGGVNVIDVEAGADRHPAAAEAVRVTREIRVEIPVDITSLSPDEAAQALTDLGLKPRLVDASTLIDIFDVLGDPGVCGTVPDPGTRLLPGSTVRVGIANRC